MLGAQRMVAGTILLSLSVLGCVAESAGGSEAILTTEQSVIIMNGIEPEYFWQPSTQESLRALAQAPLDGALESSAGNAMLSSSKGQVVLAHIVACALPEADAITGVAGVSFAGAVGLASSWKTQPLSDTASRRWVTACLLQSLNGFGVSVPIRLRGHHAALAADPHDSEFTIPDATMFGDLFDPVNRSAFACVDNPNLYSCGVTWSAYTLQRICGLSPTCGMVHLGLCTLVCSNDESGAPTCNGLTSGSYPEAIASTLEASGSGPGLGCNIALGSGIQIKGPRTPLGP